MSIVEIKRIDFNREAIIIGELIDIHPDTFELGSDGVVEILDMQSADKSFYRVHFENGSFQDIFNISRVYWDKKDIAIPGENHPSS